MAIKLRLKKDSIREFLTTQTGFSITKDDWTVVNENDVEISRILTFRNDVEFEDVIEAKKESVNETAKIEEEMTEYKAEEEIIEKPKTKKKSKKE